MSSLLRKAIYIALVGAFFLPAFAHAQSAASAGYSLTASPSQIDAGGVVTVSFTTNTTDFVGSDSIRLHHVGDPDTKYLAYKFTGGKRVASTTFVIANPGAYEFRYYKSGMGASIAASNVVTVGSGNQGIYSLAATPSQITAGESVAVSFTTNTADFVAADSIRLHRAGDPDTKYIAYQFTGGAKTGSRTFAITEPGQYEFRYYKNGRLPAIATSNVVTAAPLPASAFTLSVTPARILIGGSVTVSWTAPAGIFTSSDSIRLHRVGDPDTKYSAYQFTGTAKSGSKIFTIKDPGNYEFRYYNGGRSPAVATSTSFRVDPFSPDAITNFPSSGQNIITLGNSITFGRDASPGQDFVSLLSQRIGQPIINAGVPGDTTADGLARLESDVLSQNPRIVIIFLGGNDFLQNLPTAQTFANLRSIVDQIHARGSIVVLVGLRGRNFFFDYDLQFRNIAQATGAAHVPNVLQGIAGNPFLTTDLVHPTNAGHKIIADRIEPFLVPLVQ